MHTVVETPEYLKRAYSVSMTDGEREWAVIALAANPSAGDILKGSGGCRKIRIAREGVGRSGGYRVVTYHMATDQPLFLLTVVSKGKQASLTDAQKDELKKGVAE